MALSQQTLLLLKNVENKSWFEASPVVVRKQVGSMALTIERI